MTHTRLQEILQSFEHARIAVIGDFCLDVYWILDMKRSEVSIETGMPTHPVREQRYSLGGAGNVVSNLAALGTGTIHVFGVIGDDPWGKVMRSLLEDLNADTSGLVIQENDWATLAYIKPYTGEQELNRLDFGNFNQVSDSSAEQLLSNLSRIVPVVDVVIINQQVLEGIHSDFLRDGLEKVISQFPKTIFIADSRHFSDSYKGAWLKINDHEAARLSGINRAPEELVLRSESLDCAQRLYHRRKTPLFVSRGSRGALVCDESGVSEISGLQILGKIDTVGAGDSMLAGIACSLAAGESPATAAEIGNFVAGVTIQKLRQTGTATPEEVLQVGSQPDYIFRPELAEDPRGARYIEESEIEIVKDLPQKLSISIAIFDHDGTISTLREGWEAIMEPMMIKAILGDVFASADESTYHKVVDRVRSYIDASTGIQTIVQMKGLTEIVKEFGFVPSDQILDSAGYKQIYNEALMEMVTSRVQKLRRGELDVSDFTLKGAVSFLYALSEAGIKLYLASGTDQADVIAEAEALGYADLFEGRIFGSVGDVERDAKRVVMDRILADVGDSDSGTLVAFGDGPVEMREAERHEGIAFGIASDEVRRYSINQTKRARLIRSGAHAIAPDFSQYQTIIKMLKIK